MNLLRIKKPPEAICTLYQVPEFEASIGMAIGTVVGAGIGTAIGLSIGAGIGMTFGILYGSVKDTEAEKQGRVLKTKLDSPRYSVLFG